MYKGGGGEGVQKSFSKTNDPSIYRVIAQINENFSFPPCMWELKG